MQLKDIVTILHKGVLTQAMVVGRCHPVHGTSGFKYDVRLSSGEIIVNLVEDDFLKDTIKGEINAQA